MVEKHSKSAGKKDLQQAPKWVSRWLLRSSLLVGVWFTSGLSASDGVVEINQTCATRGGCFAGDSAGFPVTIDGGVGRSYRLTGDLDLAAIPETTAIDIDAPYITLDLNGFEIAGPISCTGSGSTLSCPLGSGDGVALSGNADFVTIRNGTIRNMARHGVGASGDRLTVIGIRAVNNARDGLNGGLESIARNCIAMENGNDGYQFGSGSVIEASSAFGNGADGIRIESSNGVIDNSTARNNGESGFVMGHSSRFGRNASSGNALPDECGGGICTDEPRYYLTTDQTTGSGALEACASGFHMAALLEIQDLGAWAYDPVLGLATADSGFGPPTDINGWIRTGDDSQSSDSCQLWTSDVGGGTTVEFHAAPNWHTAAEQISPWNPVLNWSCSVTRNVWCAED